MAYHDFSSVYDELTENVDYSYRADYICSILKKHGITDGLLLDMACGTGSLSVELSKRGFEVIGTDASPDMLTVASDKAARENQNIMFLCQRMEETDLYGTVRAVVCTLDSLNHLSGINDVRTVFSRLKNFVDDGGIMIFDVNTEYKHRNILGNNTFVYDEKNVYCVWQNSLSSDGRTVSVSLDFFVKNGSVYSRFSESFKECAFSVKELTEACEDNGFEVIDVFDELSENSPTETSERLFFTVKRVYNG